MTPYIHPLFALAGAYWLPLVAVTEASLVVAAQVTRAFWGWRP